MSESNFYDDFVAILDDEGCSPRDLEIEITETSSVEDMENFRSYIIKLHKLGITFSVDDYGIGYSSLSLLLNLPIAKLKIDKSFIDEVETSMVSHAIVHSTILLANSVGLSVVAEGVEQYGQLALLREFNCKTIQGYYFSRPVPAQALEALSQKNTFVTALEADQNLVSDSP